jgi:5-methylcytosine-specific restriction endonuclease McrA
MPFHYIVNRGRKRLPERVKHKRPLDEGGDNSQENLEIRRKRKFRKKLDMGVPVPPGPPKKKFKEPTALA